MQSPKRTATPKSTGGLQSGTRPGSGPFCPDVGDFIWVDLDPTKGREQRGRRPAIVISPQNYNVRAGLCLACPITNQGKGYPFEVQIPSGNHGVTGVVLADQIRSLSWAERNVSRMGQAPPEVLDDVIEKIAALIQIE